jgi:hypothetical protein
VTGTRATFKFHDAVAQGAGNFTFYHEWVRLNKISRKSTVAFIHQYLCKLLRLAHNYDQIDSSALASLEHATKWLIYMEFAMEISFTANMVTYFPCLVFGATWYRNIRWIYCHGE